MPGPKRRFPQPWRAEERHSLILAAIERTTRIFGLSLIAVFVAMLILNAFSY
jgi:hypothetical protein